MDNYVYELYNILICTKYLYNIQYLKTTELILVFRELEISALVKQTTTNFLLSSKLD